MNNLNNILSGLFDTNKKINNRVLNHIDNSVIHVPSGGVSGQILQVNENGVPSWVSVNNESDNEVNKISVSGMPADPDVNYNQEYELIDSTDGLIWQGLIQSEYYKECIRFGEHPGNGQTCWIFSDDTRVERFFIYSNDSDPLSIIGDQTVYDASNTAFNVKITQIGSLTIDNVNNILQNHIDNTSIHVTQADKNNWDSKIGIPSGGSNGQVLTTDGSGNYSWSNVQAGSNITVDSALSNTSENPVQNKAITLAIENIISVNNDQSSVINNHITNNSIHVTQTDKNNWNAKADANSIVDLSNRITALENSNKPVPKVIITMADSSEANQTYSLTSGNPDDVTNGLVIFTGDNNNDTSAWTIKFNYISEADMTQIDIQCSLLGNDPETYYFTMSSASTSVSGLLALPLIWTDASGSNRAELSAVYSLEDESSEPNITVDSTLSNTSENPVQNKAVTLAIENIINVNNSQTTAIDNHTMNNSIHVTSDEKNAWNAKANLPSGGSNGQVLTTDGAGNYSWTSVQAGTDITVDSALSNTSVNPVQNKVIAIEIEEIKSTLSGVNTQLNTLISETNEGTI